MRAIIVEDEKAASRLLLAILRDHLPEVEVIGIAPSIAVASQLLSHATPDLIFLDIELKDGQSFELMPLIDFTTTKIVFTTAYNQYAIQAFDYEALDYILKPYSPKMIVRAIDRLKKIINSKQTIERLYKTLKQGAESATPRVAVPTAEGLRYLELKDIIRCEATDSYTIIQTTSEGRIVVSKTLKTVEESIGSNRFVRSHKSHLVNLDHVVEVGYQGHEQIALSNGERVPLSRRRKADFVSSL